MSSGRLNLESKIINLSKIIITLVERLNDMVNVRPVKGMKDFLPEDAILFEEIIEKIKTVFRKYGFDPIITPIVEYWETLKGKYGEEAEQKEIWRFKTIWSDVEYGLRFDLTVPLARFYARFYDKLKLPFKRYQIGRAYRYEEPQKGRMREFWQADVDVVGSDTPESDAEILNIVREVIESLGIEEFEIRLNNRKIMDKLLKKLGVRDLGRAYNIIDKRYKLPDIEFVERIREVIGDYEKLMQFFEIKDPIEILEEIRLTIGEDKEIEKMLEIYDLLFDRRRFVYDISIVRGLEYYTGMVFETFPKGVKKSICSGGRYDDLIGMFLGKKIPAVGGSVGLLRLMDLLPEIKPGLKKKKTYTEIAVVYIGGRNVFKYAWEVARELREMGYNVYIDLNRKGFREQFEYIDSKGIRYVVIVGEREMNEKKLRIKDRITREEIEIKLEEIEKIKDII